MERILKGSLADIDREFRENELAYLALTTKNEHPIRDRWAFQLYRQLSGQLMVSREWRRTDLALLEGSVPKALIELKALYTFDAALKKDDINGYIHAMEADESKARKLAVAQTRIYTVLLATHPRSIVPSNLEGIVKYRAGINRAISILGSPENVLEEAILAIECKLRRINVILSGRLRGGEAFGINTDVLFWMVRA